MFVFGVFRNFCAKEATKLEAILEEKNGERSTARRGSSSSIELCYKFGKILRKIGEEFALGRRAVDDGDGSSGIRNYTPRLELRWVVG